MENKVYRIKRSHDCGFIPLCDYLKMADSEIPRIPPPHFSEPIEAATWQELATKLEFLGSADETDVVVDESGNEVAKIACDFAIPFLVFPDGREVRGSVLQAEGDVGKLDSDEYAKRFVDSVRKEN